jgi:hypothetical protein
MIRSEKAFTPMKNTVFCLGGGCPRGGEIDENFAFLISIGKIN